MVLIKSSQEKYVRILNCVCIGEHKWKQLDMSEDTIWSLKHNVNNNS